MKSASVPFLKEAPEGVSIKLCKDLYSLAAVQRFKGGYSSGEDVSIKDAGRYLFVNIKDVSGQDCLEVLNHLLYSSRNSRKKI